MLYVTECSIIPDVDNATATVNGSTPDLPIERGTEVNYECNSGYSSKGNLVAVCTSGVLDVSNLECHQGNVFCEKKLLSLLNNSFKF